MTAGNRPALYENDAKSADMGVDQVRSLTFSPMQRGHSAIVGAREVV